jgi:hypothetical protein
LGYGIGDQADSCSHYPLHLIFLLFDPSSLDSQQNLNPTARILRLELQSKILTPIRGFFSDLFPAQFPCTDIFNKISLGIIPHNTHHIIAALLTRYWIFQYNHTNHKITALMMRPDPRIRQNIDRISTSLESAADNARTGCFTFTKSYLEPCLSSLIHYCTACLPPQGKNSGLHHRRAGGRYASSRQSEFPFAFYDYLDYGSDEDEGGGRGFLAWGTDELDRLLAGSGTVSAGGPSRPGARRERMYYGAVGSSVGHGALRRKGTMEAPDPTVIPSTSMFGLLSRFGFRSKGMRYKPSAANLQEHPQRGGAISEMNGNDCSATGDRNGDLRGNNNYGNNRLGRKRSETRSSSGDDSLRSRGDLWPSDDEDDAVVIGDDAFPRSSDSDSTTRDVGFGLLGVLQDDGGRMVDGQDSVQLEETTNTAASDDVKGRNVGMNVNSNMNMNMDMKERSLQVAIQQGFNSH